MVEKQVVEQACVEAEIVTEQITEQSEAVILAEHNDDAEEDAEEEDAIELAEFWVLVSSRILLDCSLSSSSSSPSSGSLGFCGEFGVFGSLGIFPGAFSTNIAAATRRTEWPDAGRAMQLRAT